MRNILILILWLNCTEVLFGQSMVTGIVFEDLNQNGKKERRENGVEGVAISNGLEVAITNAKGEYELPVGNDNIIFVIKPSGYGLPLNDKNLPQFYYIHKPSGSPDLDFEAVAPTGDLPKSLNFPLYPQSDNQEFKVLVFGDPQPYTREEVDFFDRGIVAHLHQAEDIAFGLSLGDLVGDDLDLFEPYQQAVKKIGVPWYNVLGNHDLNFDAGSDILSDETFEAHFGPATYAFNYGKVHFIILDDVLYPDPRDQRGYWGGFRQDQLDFIKNDLQHVPQDHLVVVAFHIPISEPNGDPFRDEDREKLFQLLQDYPNTLSLSAHTHLQKQDFFGKEDGWPQDKPHHHYNVGTTSGDWYSGQLNQDGVPKSTMRDGTPKGYATITFTDNQYTFDYHAVELPKGQVMKIFSPKVVEKDQRTSAGIYVNFFIGTPDDQVEYRVNEGEWQNMNFLEEYDPLYLHKLHNWDFSEELLSGRRPSNPVKSRHLWRSPIPTNLPEGEHTIEVRATDMFGRTFSQKHSYRVALKEGL